MLSAGHPELAHGMGALAAHRFGHSLSLFSGWIGHQGLRSRRLPSHVMTVIVMAFGAVLFA